MWWVVDGWGQKNVFCVPNVYSGSKPCVLCQYVFWGAKTCVLGPEHVFWVPNVCFVAHTCVLEPKRVFLVQNLCFWFKHPYVDFDTLSTWRGRHMLYLENTPMSGCVTLPGHAPVTLSKETYGCTAPLQASYLCKGTGGSANKRYFACG